MAICNIIDDTDRTQEQHERINAHVRGSGPVPPAAAAWSCSAGTSHHRLGLGRATRPFPRRATGPGLRGGRPLAGRGQRTQFDVEMLVAGDLTGMSPQLVGAED